MSRDIRQTLLAWRQREVVRWILSLTFFFSLWYALIWVFRFPEYMLPSPTTVGRILWQDAAVLFAHARMTIFETVVGFMLALVIGVTVALVMHA